MTFALPAEMQTKLVLIVRLLLNFVYKQMVAIEITLRACITTSCSRRMRFAGASHPSRLTHFNTLKLIRSLVSDITTNLYPEEVNSGPRSVLSHH